MKCSRVANVAIALAACKGSNRDDHVERDLASVHRCLLGAPLAKDEDVDRRYRAVFLANRLAPETPRWPDRCKPVLDALAADLKHLEQPEWTTLASAVRQLLELRANPEASALTLVEAAIAKHPAAPDETVPVAPTPITLVPAPGTLPLREISDLVASPTHRTIWIADMKGEHQLCRLGPDGDKPAWKTTCAKLPGALDFAQSVMLGGAADGAPIPLLAFGGDDNDKEGTAVWLPEHDDKPMFRGRARGAYAWSADTIDLAIFERGKLVLERHRQGKVTRATIPKFTDDDVSVLDGDALYWTEDHKDGTHLRALITDAEHMPDPKQAADLGVFKRGLPHPTCASPHVHAIAFGTFIAIAVDGKWSGLKSLADRAFELTCRDKDVIAIADKSVQTCTQSGCDASHDGKIAGVDPGRALFGVIDDHPLVIWTSTDNVDMAVRLRTATADGFAVAKDRILFDGASYGGPPLIPSRVVPVPGAVLVLLYARDAYAMLRIDAKGSITDPTGPTPP